MGGVEGFLDLRRRIQRWIGLHFTWRRVHRDFAMDGVVGSQVSTRVVDVSRDDELRMRNDLF